MIMAARVSVGWIEAPVPEAEAPDVSEHAPQ